MNERLTEENSENTNIKQDEANTKYSVKSFSQVDLHSCEAFFTMLKVTLFLLNLYSVAFLSG